MATNIYKQGYRISKLDRNEAHGHQSLLVWFTGLSGSGKSTIANELEVVLHKLGVSTYVLDGDNIRFGLNKDLGFSKEDRAENLRRISEVARLMIDAGKVVLAAFVSPYKKDRESIRNLVEERNFVEVFVNTSLEECERRDVKGLYKKARRGEIKNLTGFNAPYEAPDNPEIEVNTEQETVEQAVQKILQYIQPKLEIGHE